jgi:flagellar protein FliL
MDMARKKKAKGEAEGGTDATPAAGGKSMMVPAIIVAVAVLAAGFMMKGGSGAAAAAPAPEPTEEPVHEGPVVETEPMTLNLADGHYLKVGLALQLAAPEEGEAEGGGGHGGGGGEETGPSTAKALDLAITAFSSHTKHELSDPKERARVKKHLAEEISHAYHGEVIDIYFTQFVMQ